MKKRTIGHILVWNLSLCFFSPVTANDEDVFENDVRPVLVEKCQKCHGEKKQESGLRLDSRSSLMEGGDRGPAIDLDDADESLLLQALQYDLDDLKMPPDGKLEDEQIDAIRKWIEGGAKWPDTPEAKPSMVKSKFPRRSNKGNTRTWRKH